MIHRLMSRYLLPACCALTFSALTHAQVITPIAEPGNFTRLEPEPLYENGTGPGWEDWKGNLGITEEGEMAGAAEAIFNVSEPTYEAFLPEEDINTGTAVIVAPGGGFRLLVMSHEGRSVAEWLASRGVAAFVLKYRLVQMEGLEGYGESMQRVDQEEAAVMGTADARQALTLIRERADDYDIDPERIGMVGFSAGANIVANAALSDDPTKRPAFVAPIYGSPQVDPEAIPAPDGDEPLPPFFLANSADDPVLDPAEAMTFTQSLMAAGYQPEMHLYKDGNHGYGMVEQGTSSDRWVDQFYWWMKTQGLTRQPGEPEHEIRLKPGPDFEEGVWD